MRECDQHILADHYLDLYQMAYHLLLDATEAEDAVQEAMARTFAQPRVKDPVFYCVRVLRNYCMDRLKEKYMATASMNAVAEPEDDEAKHRQAVRLQLLAEARECLPQRTNELLDMHFEEGLSVPEIAKRMGMTNRAVKRLFIKAYQLMRNKILTAEIEMKP